MRVPFIAGNWKMFKTVHETTVYVKELRGLIKDVNDVTVVIAPPFTAVHAASEAARNSNVAVSGQNMSWEREGAFTGEISAGMLTEAGAQYVIIGHSERRTLFGETDVTVNRKTIAAIAAPLTPIVCIGETLEQRERNETMDVLDRQIKGGFDGLSGDQVAALVMAYEPVWAIGTGRRLHPHRRRGARAHRRDCGSVRRDGRRRVSALLRGVNPTTSRPDGASRRRRRARWRPRLDVRSFYDIIAKSRPGGV